MSAYNGPRSTPKPPCAICGTPTEWAIWEHPMCDEHVRAWHDFEPRIDAPELPAEAVKERTDKWVAWAKRRVA